MTKWNKPTDIVSRLKKVEKQTDLAASTSTPYDPAVVPGPPTSVVLSFNIRERKTHLEYHAKVTWLPPTVGACQADVDYYVIQIRPTNAAGVPHDDPGGKRSLFVDGAAFDVGENPYAIFYQLEKPKTWYWQARVQAVDHAGRKGTWSAWSTQQLPVQVAEPIPPTPTGVALNFDRMESAKHNPWRVIVSWDEINNWDVPGGDGVEDIARYAIQLRRTDSGGTELSANYRQKTKEAKDNDADTTAKVTFRGVKKKAYYQARVRAIDKYNRRGLWSSWSAVGQAADAILPPVPTNVVAQAGIERIIVEWDAPVDPDDSELPHEDVAYFQVQAHKNGGFSNLFKKDTFVSGERKDFVTKKYNQNYWLRVRSVDGAGNKSAWVNATGNPIRPLKAQAQSGSEPDIDWTNEAGLDLVGDIRNRVTLSATGNNRRATIDNGESLKDGTLRCTITLSPTTNRAYAGLVFRGNSTDWLIARLIKTGTAGNDAIELVKRAPGDIYTVLSASAAAGLVNGQTYNLRVDLNGDSVKVYLDEVLKIDYTLAGADSTTYNAADKVLVGVYSSRGASTLDDGKSRWANFRFIGLNSIVYLSDSFDRTAGSLNGSVADSGQAWTANTGTWDIAAEALPKALFGSSMISPMFHAEDLTTKTVTLATTSPPAHSYVGVDLEIDRPMKAFCWGWANIKNDDVGASRVVRFFIIVEQAGVDSTGAAGVTYFPNDSNQRQIVNMRSEVLSGTYPLRVKFKWGFQSVGGNMSGEIVRMKMIVAAFYAPDIVATDPMTKIAWMNSGITKTAYVKAESDE